MSNILFIVLIVIIVLWNIKLNIQLGSLEKEVLNDQKNLEKVYNEIYFEDVTYNFFNQSPTTQEINRLAELRKVTSEGIQNLKTKLEKLEKYLEIKYLVHETRKEGYEKITVLRDNWMNAVSGGSNSHEPVTTRIAKKAKSKK